MVFCAQPKAGCYSLLRAGHLLGSAAHLLGSAAHGSIRLLLKKGPSFVGLGLKVCKIADEADRIHDALVVEEHTSDLTGGFAVALLNDLVDVVTDLLATFDAIETLNTLKVGLVDEHLLRLRRLLLLASHHLLLHNLGLIRGNGLTGGGISLRN